MSKMWLVHVQTHTHVITSIMAEEKIHIANTVDFI